MGEKRLELKRNQEKKKRGKATRRIEEKTEPARCREQRLGGGGRGPNFSNNLHKRKAAPAARKRRGTGKLFQKNDAIDQWAIP